VIDTKRMTIAELTADWMKRKEELAEAEQTHRRARSDECSAQNLKTAAEKAEQAAWDAIALARRARRALRTHLRHAVRRGNEVPAGGAGAPAVVNDDDER